MPQVGLEHLHIPKVSVREQAAVLVERLRQMHSASFRHLVADCTSQLVVVARFLALLELFRDGVISFDQITPLGDLRIRWTGSDDHDISISDEFDVEPHDIIIPEVAVDPPTVKE
jgi:segregation and condensation protein A